MKKAQFISFLLVLIFSNSSFAQYFSGPFKETNSQFSLLYKEFFKDDEKVLKTWYHYTVSFSEKDQKYILRLFQPEKHILLSETRFLDKKLQTKDGLFLKLDYSSFNLQVGFYKNNVEEGKWVSIDTLGNVRSTFIYVKGKKQGYASNFYENNILKEKLFYQDDRYEGKYEMFYKNGKLAEEGFYKESKKDGEYKVYDSTGVQSKFFVYENGEKVKTIIYNNGVVNENVDSDIILTVSDEAPCFVDESGYNVNSNIRQECDIKKMYGFLGDNIRFPVIAQKLNISGKVFVRFVIEKNGDVNEVKVISGLCQALEDESVSVIKSMPRWKPGVHNGKPVRVFYTMPIVYTLE